MESYKIDKTVFSEGDISTILIGLSSISGTIQNNELVHALAKVKKFIPTDKIRDIELKTNQIHIDLSPWLGNSSL